MTSAVLKCHTDMKFYKCSFIEDYLAVFLNLCPPMYHFSWSILSNANTSDGKHGPIPSSPPTWKVHGKGQGDLPESEAYPPAEVHSDLEVKLHKEEQLQVPLQLI